MEKVMKSNDEKILRQYLNSALNMLHIAKIVFPVEAVINIYHHAGIQKVTQEGATFVNVVNRDYSKSYVIMTPGQRYPEHYHRIKTESFYVLYGELTIESDGEVFKLHPGEMHHVERGENHSFRTDLGVVFEEISTMYMPNDSVYTDESILKTSYAQRRTTINGNRWKEIREKWKQ